jgi:hypothetical protein
VELIHVAQKSNNWQAIVKRAMLSCEKSNVIFRFHKIRELLAQLSHSCFLKKESIPEN